MKFLWMLAWAAPAAVGWWQSNIYTLLFGCAWLVASAVFVGAEVVGRSIRDSGQLQSLHAERVGLQVATAVNAGATSYRKRGA